MMLKTGTVLALSVLAAMSAQAAAGSKHNHPRKNERASAFEQLRNSNAYAAPALQSSRPNYDEGAMTSGIAGH